MASLTSQLLVRLVDGISGPARKASGSLSGIGRAMHSLNGLHSRLGGALERNAAALDAARGRMLDAVAAAYALRRALGAPIGAAVAFESAMADVAKVSGFDDAGIAAFGKQLRQLAVNEIPMAVTELAALAANAAQAGVPDADLLGFTRITAKAATAWEMSGDAAGEALAKIRTQLGLTNDQTRLFADAINHLSDNSAASAGDLVDYAKRVSAQGEFFGFAKEATLAFGSAMIGAGAQSEVAATSFRNMGRALTRGGSASKAQRRAWRTLGLDAIKVSKAMQKDAVGTTLKVIEKLGQLPDHMQAAIMSDLFGDEARALAPLLNDIDQLKKALGLVAEETAYAGSVTKEFERRARTTAYAWQKFKSQINEVGLAVGNALLPALNDLMEKLGPIVIKIAEWAEKNPELTQGIVAATTALIALKIAAAGLTFAGLIGKGGALYALRGALTGVMFVGRPVARLMDTLAVRAALATAATGKAPGIFARLADAMLVLGRGVSTFPVGMVNAIATGVSRLGWWGAAAAAAGLLIYNNWSGLGEFFTAFGSSFMNGIGPIKPAIDAAITAIAPLKPALDIVVTAAQGVVNPFGRLSGLVTTMAGYLRASDEAWRSLGQTLGSFTAGTVIAVLGTIKSYLLAVKRLADGVRESLAGLAGALGGGTPPSVAGKVGLGSGGGAGIPARAGGGPIDPGQPTLVGEEGPEIITAGRSGYVHPNSALGGLGGGRVIRIGKIVVNGAGDPERAAALIEKRMQAVLDDSFADRWEGR